MSLENFFLFTNPRRAECLSCTQRIANTLHQKGLQVFCEKALCQSLPFAHSLSLSKLSSKIHMVLSVGGDGTLLRIAPYAAQKNIPLLGVHMGTIGFLMEIDDVHIEKAIENLLTHNYFLEKRMMLCASIQGHKKLYALNDFSLTRGDFPGVIQMQIHSNDEFVYTLTGDGVLLSTPTGATAYALAAGAPIIHPDLECLLITPLCAREMLAKPALFCSDACITLKTKECALKKPNFSVDGQIKIPLTFDQEIHIQKANFYASFVRFSKSDFFTQLKTKQAHWNHLSIDITEF